MTWLRTSSHMAAAAPLRTVPFTSFRGVEASPSFCPDGSLIAFAWNPREDDDFRIFVKPIGDDPPRQLTEGPGSDLFPSWSPDGRSIAFTRMAGERSALFIIPSLGGPEREVLSTARREGAWRCECAARWSPDGHSLVFVAPLGDSCQLQVLSLDTFERRALTSPTLPLFDALPAFSPDGRTVAFVRYRNVSLGDIYLIPAEGGAPTRLTHDDARLWGSFAWTPDGKSIVFAGNRAGSDALWQLKLAGGQPERLPVGGERAADPTVDASGRRLAYVVFHEDSELYALDLTRPDDAPTRVAPSSRFDHMPQFSPDGRRIAFASARGGVAPDIWVANENGSNPVRLTFFDRFSSTPRWSPDGQWIVFDSAAHGSFDIFIVRAVGGAPRQLTTDPADDAIPSWSRDGHWIYFESARTGSPQMWRMPAEGGAATQLTKEGGFGGFESADGRYVYYSKGEHESGI
jgi:Tol biopolymer transport system component